MLLELLQNDNGAKKWNQESQNFIIKKEKEKEKRRIWKLLDFLIV
jgi:hypothetical protein